MRLLFSGTLYWRTPARPPTSISAERLVLAGWASATTTAPWNTKIPVGRGRRFPRAAAVRAARTVRLVRPARKDPVTHRSSPMTHPARTHGPNQRPLLLRKSSAGAAVAAGQAAMLRELL